MQAVFYLFSVLKKRRLAKRFFKCLNWQAALPQQGSTITFALKSKEPDNNAGQLKTGKVIEHEQLDETRIKAWVDMGEFTEDLKKGRIEVQGWREISSPQPPE